MPWFVALTEWETFPRLSTTNRLRRKAKAVFGPFPNRDVAQHYEQEVLGLFQMRRCTETLVPKPDHPGCIYGEMNQCLRPCQCAITVDEYKTEVQRVTDFLLSNGRTAIGTLQAARDRATEQTQFEHAAEMHKRIEKMRTAAMLRNDAITEIRQFNGVALTRAVAPGYVRLWPMVGSCWQEPLALEVATQASGTRSLDAELRERLSSALGSPSRTEKPLEDLAIFSRWYYSSWRDGEWFSFRTITDLNYRRLIRELAKLVRPESAAN